MDGMHIHGTGIYRGQTGCTGVHVLTLCLGSAKLAD